MVYYYQINKGELTMKKIYWNKRGNISVEIIMLLLVVAILLGLIWFGAQKETADWNNGYCPVCGTKYRYVQAIGHRYSTAYIYVCDTCNEHIEVSQEPNWNEVTSPTEIITETTSEDGT